MKLGNAANLNRIKMKGKQVRIHLTGGQEQIRGLFRHCTNGADGTRENHCTEMPRKYTSVNEL